MSPEKEDSDAKIGHKNLAFLWDLTQVFSAAFYIKVCQHSFKAKKLTHFLVFPAEYRIQAQNIDRNTNLKIVHLNE